MAQLTCTFDEFISFIDPKIRNDVQSVTKPKKKKLGHICQHCGNKVKELQAAHKHDFSKKSIIKSILDDYKSEEGKYIISNLLKVINKIKDKHKSDEVFFFLCKKCHDKYDNSNKIKNTVKNISKNDNTDNYDLKQIILTLFKENQKKFYTPKNMFEIIQKRNTKYYADTLWGLWKQGFLTHPQRGYYQWNSKK